MVFPTPSSKEHTMKRIATTLLAVAIVALTLASVASAYRGHRGLSHGSHAPALHHHRAAY
jgi:hypothetical protein